MLAPGGRMLARTRLPCLKSFQTSLGAISQERVSVFNNSLQLQHDNHALSSSRLVNYPARRFLADAAVSRPKAHTGRTAKAPRKARAKKAATTAEQGEKTEVKKPKSKKRTAKRKSKAGSKAKAKPKKRLTEVQKAAKKVKVDKAKVSDLKKKALLKKPKALPDSAWTVFNSERAKTVLAGKKGISLGETAKETSAQYKALTPEQIEHYNHIANQNKAANQSGYRKWITSYTPSQIREANAARLYLARHLTKKNSQKYSKLKDERLVRRPRTAYILFATSRHSSGDFKGLAIAEAAKLAGKEWKELSSTDKKRFTDEAAQDLARYKQEAETVYSD